MTEAWFYHLDAWPLEKVLPVLLEKSVARGWRAAVQASTQERVDALDLALWTYDDASFLPHGTDRDGDAERQPILLTLRTDNTNAAAIRFLLDGADPLAALAVAGAAYERLVLLFDGNDVERRAEARRHWTDLKKSGHGVAYWQQNGDGGWDRRG